MMEKSLTVVLQRSVIFVGCKRCLALKENSLVLWICFNSAHPIVICFEVLPPVLKMRLYVRSSAVILHPLHHPPWPSPPKQQTCHHRLWMRANFERLIISKKIELFRLLALTILHLLLRQLSPQALLVHPKNAVVMSRVLMILFLTRRKKTLKLMALLLIQSAICFPLSRPDSVLSIILFCRLLMIMMNTVSLPLLVSSLSLMIPASHQVLRPKKMPNLPPFLLHHTSIQTSSLVWLGRGEMWLWWDIYMRERENSLEPPLLHLCSTAPDWIISPLPRSDASLPRTLDQPLWLHPPQSSLCSEPHLQDHPQMAASDSSCHLWVDQDSSPPIIAYGFPMIRYNESQTQNQQPHPHPHQAISLCFRNDQPCLSLPHLQAPWCAISLEEEGNQLCSQTASSASIYSYCSALPRRSQTIRSRIYSPHCSRVHLSFASKLGQVEEQLHLHHDSHLPSQDLKRAAALDMIRRMLAEQSQSPFLHNFDPDIDHPTHLDHHLRSDPPPVIALRSRLRLDCIRLNAPLHKRRMVPSPACPHCGRLETIIHVLLQCRQYAQTRDRFIDGLGHKPPDDENVSEGHSTERRKAVDRHAMSASLNSFSWTLTNSGLVPDWPDDLSVQWCFTPLSVLMPLLMHVQHVHHLLRTKRRIPSFSFRASPKTSWSKMSILFLLSSSCLYFCPSSSFRLTPSSSWMAYSQYRRYPHSLCPFWMMLFFAFSDYLPHGTLALDSVHPFCFLYFLFFFLLPPEEAWPSSSPAVSSHSAAAAVESRDFSFSPPSFKLNPDDVKSDLVAERLLESSSAETISKRDVFERLARESGMNLVDFARYVQETLRNDVRLFWGEDDFAQDSHRAHHNKQPPLPCSSSIFIFSVLLLPSISAQKKMAERKSSCSFCFVITSCVYRFSGGRTGRGKLWSEFVFCGLLFLFLFSPCVR